MAKPNAINVYINPNTFKEIKEAIAKGQAQANSLIGCRLRWAIEGKCYGRIAEVYEAAFDPDSGHIFVSVYLLDKRGNKSEDEEIPYVGLQCFEPISPLILRRLGLASKASKD